jgi:hypothetical protein
LRYDENGSSLLEWAVARVAGPARATPLPFPEGQRREADPPLWRRITTKKQKQEQKQGREQKAKAGATTKAALG